MQVIKKQVIRRQYMKQVLVVSGKSTQVFKYLKLLARYKGDVTLGELAKKQKKATKV
jgi:hypothetical protein